MSNNRKFISFFYCTLSFVIIYILLTFFFFIFREPLFVFDVASSVGDIAWAPYSSTVLAAVSQDCKAYVFDLNVDKYKAICVQTVSSRKLSKLTRIAFNWKLPIVIIGDDK